MSDMQRASKAFFKSSSEPDTGVFPTRASTAASARTPMRPASGFSAVPGDVKKASWDELTRERESDGETKNYSVPPELIELARRAKKGRSEVGTLTPLAPKPAQDVVVVVPAASRLVFDKQDAGADPVSSLQAPSVQIEMEANAEPESQPTVVYSEAFKAAVSSSPLIGDMLETELATDQSAAAPADATTVHPSSSRRSSRRARRSVRIEMPVEASEAARAAEAASSAPKPYMPYLVGGAILGFYILLCYYGNALLAGLP